MDCIQSEGEVTRLNLLTQTDKLKKIEELLANKRHTSDLFLPDDNFYGEYVSAEDPERMANLLFAWLGIKHKSITFHVDPSQEELIHYTRSNNTSQVTFGYRILKDQLVCAASVAHAIVHHLLLARSKVSLANTEENEALTDLGTIYAGFGILVLNAISSGEECLGAMGSHNYANEFLDYCNEHRIVKHLWEPYILPHVSSELLMSKPTRRKLMPFIKKYVVKTHNQQRKKIYILGSIITISTALLIYTLTSPTQSNTQLLEMRETIVILKAQYEQCQKIVAYKQQHWDLSDIFIQRQIEADKSRCTSIKNRYQYEANLYNSKL